MLARPLSTHLANQVVALLLVRPLTLGHFPLLQTPPAHLHHCRVTQLPFNPFHCYKRLPSLISRSNSGKDLLTDMLGNLEHPPLQDDLWRVWSVNIGSSLDDGHISLRRGDAREEKRGNNGSRLFGLSLSIFDCPAPLCLHSPQRLPSDALQPNQNLRAMLVCLQCKEVLKMGQRWVRWPGMVLGAPTCRMLASSAVTASAILSAGK